MTRILILIWCTAIMPAVRAGIADCGCISPADTPPPCHTVNLSGVSVTCHGMANGSATYVISKPGTYQVLWQGEVVYASTTTQSHTFHNLTAGYYDVQVIDLVSGCSAYDIINITQPMVLATDITVIQHVRCYGQASGLVNLNVTGGNTGFQYSWSGGQHTQNLVNIVAGKYYVTVTDNKNCTAKDSATVTQPAQPLGQSVLSDNPACYGDTNGWADLTVWGGTPPYVYTWNNGVLSQDLFNIGQGSYFVTVKDVNNCTINTSVSLTSPPPLTVTLNTTDNLCYGDSLGSIDVSPAGGTPPYAFTWANSTFQLAWTGEDATGLPNDQWYVTVTDAHACSFSGSAIISSPNEIVTGITSTNVTSYGGINGSVSLTVSGGVSPYAFLWSNGGTNQNLSGIPAGYYTVTVTDANLCTRVDGVEVTQPSDPLAVDLVTEDNLCFGGSTGLISSIATGGTPPYTYLWSNGSILPEIFGLTAGVYMLTVTDFFGNIVADTTEIKQPDAISLSFSVSDVSCFGLSNGAINVTVSGGTAPYSYTWMNSSFVLAAITEDVDGIPAGQYYLMVTDTFGCTGSFSIWITQPDKLIMQIEHTDAYCAGSATGTAVCSVAGGTPAYEYQWSGGQQTSGIFNLYQGYYAVTVTDQRHCIVTDSVQINEAEPLTVEVEITPVSCNDQHDGKISVTAAGGNGGYSWLWSNNATGTDLSNLEAGVYHVTLTDLMGCTAENTFTVPKIDVDCISIPSCFTPNGDGFNDTWVIKNAVLYPAFHLEVFNRWGQVVHRQEGSYEPWDSYFNNKPLPAETYYYFLRIHPQSQVLTGNVTIIR
ncbi:MAG TPA: gliding motility-associated C-terminal domain-containing protein [Bacteroidales bacterium]|nr:gliding motility-associated C-terminal domain-containing protein [Bacteroidales bacterium]HSA42872.1 gliding motility-associated C-terminal domain-containing protein [Bacteroidales bacterium]